MGSLREVKRKMRVRVILSKGWTESRVGTEDVRENKSMIKVRQRVGGDGSK